MILKKHHQEAIILRRRLEMLDICDQLILHGIAIDDYERPELDFLFSQFSDVREVEDLIASLQKVYQLNLKAKTEAHSTVNETARSKSRR